jgi:hypothetical protein
VLQLGAAQALHEALEGRGSEEAGLSMGGEVFGGASAEDSGRSRSGLMLAAAVRDVGCALRSPRSAVGCR